MNDFIVLRLESDIEHEEMAGSRLNLRYYLRQQPVMLAIALVLIVIAFLAVTALSHAYHAQREALGDRWFNRGVADLNANNFSSAVTEFRAALLYSRDNYDYQLNLAEALIGLKHTGEASSYLINLWEREPEDGLVNLELARINAQQSQNQAAIRYYHDAIYAFWPNGEDVKRRDARFELVELFLRVNDRTEAQAELIALSQNVGDDAVLQQRVGDLFLRAQDPEHALAAYRTVLRLDVNNAGAVAGAGRAAYELRRYPLAQRYLQPAVAANPNDPLISTLLKTTEMVLSADPFQDGISADQRDRLVVEAFTTAGDRLKACALPDTSIAGPAHLQPGLSEEWTELAPRVTESGLRGDPDLAESAMDLVFHIERQTAKLCGQPAGKDLALLLIAKSHEGSN